jgi:hypothetical protein
MVRLADQLRENEVLRRMLKTPPKPHAPLKARKAKASRAIRAKTKKPAKA